MSRTFQLGLGIFTATLNFAATLNIAATLAFARSDDSSQTLITQLEFKNKFELSVSYTAVCDGKVVEEQLKYCYDSKDRKLPEGNGMLTAGLGLDLWLASFEISGKKLALHPKHLNCSQVKIKKLESGNWSLNKRPSCEGYAGGTQFSPTNESFALAACGNEAVALGTSSPLASNQGSKEGEFSNELRGVTTDCRKPLFVKKCFGDCIEEDDSRVLDRPFGTATLGGGATNHKFCMDPLEQRLLKKKHRRSPLVLAQVCENYILETYKTTRCGAFRVDYFQDSSRKQKVTDSFCNDFALELAKKLEKFPAPQAPWDTRVLSAPNERFHH